MSFNHQKRKKYGGIAVLKAEVVSKIRGVKGGLNFDISLNNKGLEIKEPTDANLRTIMDILKKQEIKLITRALSLLTLPTIQK